MGATATPSEEQVPVKILVDRDENKVLFAEAGKDFVDVLFSFLTLPLGTIARLVGKESNMVPVRVGCLSSLYESVANLDQQCLRTKTCKEMLVQPRNSLEDYCRNLKLNIDDTEPTKYFICEDLDCSRGSTGLLSTYRNIKCHCGKSLNRKISRNPKYSNINNGFVRETATFIISDDLNVMPNVLGTSVALLQKLGIEDMHAIEEHTVNIHKKEVVDLLKCSLVSMTPLTDLFLKGKPSLDNFNLISQSQFQIGEVPTDEGRQMVVKVLVRKSNGKILFAQGEQDFADFLFTFLTSPLGGVLHMLEGSSSLSCVDKLYKSMAELSSDKYLRSQEVRDNLVNPQCALHFKLTSQILPIGEACLPMYWLHTYCKTGRQGKVTLCGYLSTSPDYESPNHEPLNYVDPKSSPGESSSPREFAKGPSMYMVTDDLVVTPMSSISGVSYLKRSKVPLCDLEERVIAIGMEEGLSILKASLSSTSALTNGLNRFIKPLRRRIDQLFLSCLKL